MKTEKEVRGELKRIRERAKSLSGFWIGEAAASIYALEWAAGKREMPPSEDVGRARGGSEGVAASLAKLVAKSPPRLEKKKPAPSARRRKTGRRS